MKATLQENVIIFWTGGYQTAKGRDPPAQTLAKWAAAWALRGRAHSHARGLRHSRAGAQTALACSTRLAPRVRRLENSPGTAMPQPTRGVWFGSCGVSLLDRAARCRARGVNRRGRSQTSEVRNQKQKKRENRKRGNGKSKMGDGIHGVLATRNPIP